MKKLTLVLAMVPALALAQGTPARNQNRGSGAGPGSTAAPSGGQDDAARTQRIQKRLRLAATLGFAEAVDLDEQGAMRVRDIFARDSEKRFPLQTQVRDSIRVLRDAARGDQAATGQVDASLTKLRDARAQLQKLDDDTFKQLTTGLSADKKAKAALFLARFRERGRHMAMMHGGMHGEGRGSWGGPGGSGGPGRGGPGGGPRGSIDDGGRGSGMGMGMMMERHASMMGESDEPELEEWYGDE